MAKRRILRIHVFFRAPIPFSPILPFPVSPNLITGSHSVLARFAGADVNALAVVHFDFDRLIAAVTADVEAHVVSFLA